MTRRRHSLADIKDFASELYNNLNETGEFDGTELDGAKFTIVQSWEAWNEFVTNIIHFAGLYPLYKPAIAFEMNDQFPPKLVINHAPGSKPKELRELQYGDLRLGRNGLHPGDNYPTDEKDRWGQFYQQTPYLVPEVVQPVEEIIEEIMGDWGFSDEYDTCDNCHKALRTSPDSYGWQPDYVEIADGRYCMECTDVDEVLEAYCRKRRGIPPQIESKAIADGTLVLMPHSWDNGLHQGMNDDPKKIAKALRAMGLTEWWWHLEPSQFYVSFQLLLKPDAIETLAGVYDKAKETGEHWAGRYSHAEDDHGAKADAVLENIDAYQGYDQATEMSRALQGLPTEHVTVVSTMIDLSDPKMAEAWRDGKILDVAREKAAAEAGVTPITPEEDEDQDDDEYNE